MDLVRETKKALLRACDKAGNQLRLQEKTGVSYAVINKFHSGKRDIGNMTLYTLEKLFPELDVSYFRDEVRLSGFSNLSRSDQKLLKIIVELDEDGKLDALEALITIRERRRLAGEVETSKHVRDQAG